MQKELMRYIPKICKNEVEDIYKGEKVWNEHTNRWNSTIIVKWKDGEVNEYQNSTYMKGKLAEFGRD